MLAKLSVQDIGVIYSAVLSTTIAVVGAGVAIRRQVRGRKVIVRFGYGIEWNNLDNAGVLSVRVHNDSPAASLELLQIGWRSADSPSGHGEWWDVAGPSIPIGPRGTYVHNFDVQSLPRQLVGTAIFSDQNERVGDRPFDVPSWAGVKLSGATEIRLRTEDDQG